MNQTASVSHQIKCQPSKTVKRIYEVLGMGNGMPTPYTGHKHQHYREVATEETLARGSVVPLPLGLLFSTKDLPLPLITTVSKSTCSKKLSSPNVVARLRTERFPLSSSSVSTSGSDCCCRRQTETADWSWGRLPSDCYSPAKEGAVILYPRAEPASTTVPPKSAVHSPSTTVVVTDNFQVKAVQVGKRTQRDYTVRYLTKARMPGKYDGVNPAADLGKFINYVKSCFRMTDLGGYSRSLAVKESNGIGKPFQNNDKKSRYLYLKPDFDGTTFRISQDSVDTFLASKSEENHSSFPRATVSKGEERDRALLYDQLGGGWYQLLSGAKWQHLFLLLLLSSER
ncbi:hypothetical protein GH733_008806 [Mirounga leonina]|nr:hypothetical protein GH733_008806 [Mirounga leonina]